MILQPLDDLENWHKKNDPWDYKTLEDDSKRKLILLDKIPGKEFSNVLDIGCGQGFVTEDLPGKNVVGVDISKNAIKHAKKKETSRIKFMHGDIFEIDNLFRKKFDLIIITGVIYPQYIGESHNLVYIQVDKVLKKNGILVTVHVDEWYKARFPYFLLETSYYNYRHYVHRLDVYQK